MDSKWLSLDCEQDSKEPIILSRVDLGDGWWPDVLAGILKLERDENGTYIVTDHRTVVYGDGDTSLDALRDYIVSLIEYMELKLKGGKDGRTIKGN